MGHGIVQVRREFSVGRPAIRYQLYVALRLLFFTAVAMDTTGSRNRDQRGLEGVVPGRTCPARPYRSHDCRRQAGRTMISAFVVDDVLIDVAGECGVPVGIYVPLAGWRRYNVAAVVQRFGHFVQCMRSSDPPHAVPVGRIEESCRAPSTFHASSTARANRCSAASMYRSRAVPIGEGTQRPLHDKTRPFDAVAGVAPYGLNWSSFLSASAFEID